MGPYEYLGVISAPVISSLSPADDATGVSTTANLVLTFNEIVDVETGNVTIYKQDDTLVEAIDVTSGQVTGTGTTTIVVDPTSAFDELQAYYVQIDATAFDDVSSNSYAGIANETSWTFTTADETNPTVSTLSPTDDATSVATTANLIITFAEAVDVETGNISLYDSDDTLIEAIDVTGGLVTGTGTTIITIDPTANFDEQTSYYIQIDATAFDDTSSNSYAGITDTTSWSFTSADETNPTASTLSPANDETDVLVDTDLTMTFSEIVDVETGDISLYDGSDTLIEAIDVTSGLVTGTGSTTITINPTDDLTLGTTYYVQIDATGFDDEASNSYAGIADATTWTFSTAAPVADTADGGSFTTLRNSRTQSQNEATQSSPNISDSPELTLSTNAENKLKSSIDIRTSYSGRTTAIDFGKAGEFEEEENSCADIPENHWAKEMINILLEFNFYPIERENSGINCNPSILIKRAELITWLTAGYYSETTDGLLNEEIPFIDLAPNDPMAPFIVKAYYLGFISGYAEGDIRAEDEITRAELLKVLSKTVGQFKNTDVELNFFKEKYPEKDPMLLFNDINRDTDWFYPYLYFATANGIDRKSVV